VLYLIRCHFLPTWLGGKPIAFTASGSIRDRLHERNKAKRAPLLRRLRLIIFELSVYFHIIYFIYAWGAAILNFIRAGLVGRRENTVAALHHLLVHSLLPPVWWLTISTAFLIPLFYAIWPPIVPDREELLVRDSTTLVARPKIKEIKQTWGFLPLVRELEFAFVLVYVTILFVGMFIY
jgi:hypothetical protein